VARNTGIRASSGEYVAFLDSDDTWLPAKLARQVPLFRDKVGLVYCAICEVDDNGALIRTVPCEQGMRGRIYERLLVRNRMTGGSVVVTRRALETAGLFDETLRAAENWDLWIRISKEFDVDFVDEPLVNYLKHESNMSRDVTRMQEATWTLLQKHLPQPLEPSHPLYSSYQEAYANFFYNCGVASFGIQRYSDARKEFMECWRYLPHYRDSKLRYFRTYLGRLGNGLLSMVAKTVR
jgi:glycosyltransferase involved in cell wall biosynthesis